MLGDLSGVSKIYRITGRIDMRLDNGRFQWPRDASEARQLSRQEYRWFMEGLSIDQPRAFTSSRKRDF